MKRLLISGLLGLALLPRAGVAAALLYENTGTTLNPQVDALNFVNKGLFQASGTAPYETWSTLNFTNAVGTYSGSGTMVGLPGFRFSTTSPLNGMRSMASSFFNDNGALVQAVDGPIFSFYTCRLAPISPSHLIVSATNVVVKAGTSGTPKGSLIVGSFGGMDLTARNMDISRSGLEVLPVWTQPQGSGNGETNFIPDIAIADLYWGRTNFTEDFALFTAGLWNGITARAQGGRYPDVRRPPIVNPPAIDARGDPGFAFSSPVADSYINALPFSMMTVTITNRDGSTTDIRFSTNITKGAVFVAGSSGMSVVPGFSAGVLANGFLTASVLLSVQVSNLVTTRMDPAYIHVEDRLASGGTTGRLSNIIGCPPFTTLRPANYNMSRFPFFPGGEGNNGYPQPDFFLGSNTGDPAVIGDGVTNSRVPGGEYSSYSAFVDNVVTRPPPVAGGTVTNLPGRIRISADSLDMSRARLRAEGQIMIQTSHLITSSNAVVDSEHLSFNLASTNGNLRVQNLSKDTALRFLGQIRVWSATWSNTAVVLWDNYSIDTNGLATPAPVTNTVTIGYHTLMVDARSLGIQALPVRVHGFTSRSTNVVISDNMSVAESMLIDGRSLTLVGNLTIPGTVPVVNPILNPPLAPPGVPFRDWTYANTPTLQFFTNHGIFTIANDAHFGDDRATPYSTFVNTGTVSAASIAVNSTYLENRGRFVSSGLLFLQSPNAKLEGGSSFSGGDSQFLAGSLKFNGYQMTVNGGLYLNASSALFDAGGSSSNVFTLQNGFHLPARPPTGDLLGTAFQTRAPAVPSIWIDHTWAGADRGSTAAGYTNNTALGRLVVSSLSPDPLFYFAGTGLQNGLYVDLLDLTATGTNYQRQMAIDPSLVIYFAAARLGFTPPPSNGIPQLPEEYLDGQFEGRLRWVQGFAGPNSSIATIVNGKSVQVNLALRSSKLIDSNGNGIPNFYDAFPFAASGVKLTASLPAAAPAVAISWMAAPNTVYQVEYSSNPALNTWQTLLRYTNNVPTNRLVSVSDSIAPSVATRRFYRVGFSP